MYNCAQEWYRVASAAPRGYRTYGVTTIPKRCINTRTVCTNCLMVHKVCEGDSENTPWNRSLPTFTVIYSFQCRNRRGISRLGLVPHASATLERIGAIHPLLANTDETR